MKKLVVVVDYFKNVLADFADFAKMLFDYQICVICVICEKNQN